MMRSCYLRLVVELVLEMTKFKAAVRVSFLLCFLFGKNTHGRIVKDVSVRRGSFGKL
ncbi:hypothetical protein Syun_004164 [Stephania yunnanensis]|uniref:Uncharacterized protein n=1 Tax=Stephania yunnanensis TaxID=152371 RepID=A0AAP0L418_9MAGN